MTARRRRALLAVPALLVALGVAACSSPGKPAASPSDSTTPAAASQGQVTALLVQCFIGHHLIPAASLDVKNSSPPDDASTWLQDGKVVANERFGDWYSDVGAGVMVHGKIIGEWVSEISSSVKAWPASICGQMPHT
jgi:hypothetical protein